MTEDERSAAALRDLSEFGWIHVPGEAWAAKIAAVAAATTGKRFRITPLCKGWFCVEEVSEGVRDPH